MSKASHPLISDARTVQVSQYTTHEQIESRLPSERNLVHLKKTEGVPCQTNSLITFSCSVCWNGQLLQMCREVEAN